MSGPKEVVEPRKPAKLDVITPHRVSVAILIRGFTQFRDSDEYKCFTSHSIQAKYRKDTCLLFLKLLQSPDISLEELWQLLTTSKYVIPQWVVTNFKKVTTDMITNPISNMIEFIDSLNRIMTFGENRLIEPNKSLVSKTSTIGYFLRRLIVNFDRLMFTEITKVYHACKRYVGSARKALDWVSKLEDCLDAQEEEGVNKDLWTRRQAEFFITTQATLLTTNEEKAMPPNELQNTITSLLKTNQSLAEAHFLSYLNCLRVKEYSGAVSNLYQCFDKKNDEFQQGCDDKSKICRYAALNLAILNYQFDYHEEALASLKESIRLAQDSSDNVCLQHALTWLYRLTTTNKGKLIENSVLKSFELSLSYTTSLGIQTFVQLACVISGCPFQIFETLAKSDIINCQHNHRDLISNSYAVKASLWQFYGKAEMSSLWSQLLFFINIDNPKPTKAYYGEAFCLSICNVSNYLFNQGDYNHAFSVLNFAKNRFPNEPNSLTWKLVENVFVFTRALYEERWNEAESAAQKLMVLDKWEGYYRLAELFFHRFNFAEASRSVNVLIDLYRKNDKYKIKSYHYVRAKILLAEIQLANSYKTDAPRAWIMDLLNNCLIQTHKCQLDYFTAIIYMHIAHIQLHLKMTTQAVRVMEKCILQMMAHAGCYDRGRCCLIYAKCLIADAYRMEATKKREVLLKAASVLRKARDNFKAIQALAKLKYVLYFQSQVYNTLKMDDERNEAAHGFRAIDEEYKFKHKQL